MNAQEPEAVNPALEMLSNLGIDDPRMRKFAELIGQQRAFGTGKVASTETSARRARAIAQVKARLQQGRELREENALLREKLEMLAAALGSCPDCWGEDNACPRCGGRGEPGAFLPDQDAFAAFVLPAVRVLHGRPRATREGRLGPASQVQQASSEGLDDPSDQDTQLASMKPERRV